MSGTSKGGIDYIKRPSGYYKRIPSLGSLV
jgi:hypothetical protein